MKKSQKSIALGKPFPYPDETDDNEIKNKINQIRNNKKLIINKIASILEQDPYGNKWVFLFEKQKLDNQN